VTQFSKGQAGVTADKEEFGTVACRELDSPVKRQTKERVT